MKPSRPNNFPREGKHNIVSADEIARLEALRPRLNPMLRYTTGETHNGIVHSSEEADRMATINRGHRILKKSSQGVHGAISVAGRKPVKIDFDDIDANPKISLVQFRSQALDMVEIKERAQERIQSQSHGQSQSQGQDI